MKSIMLLSIFFVFSIFVMIPYLASAIENPAYNASGVPRLIGSASPQPVKSVKNTMDDGDYVYQKVPENYPIPPGTAYYSTKFPASYKYGTWLGGDSIRASWTAANWYLSGNRYPRPGDLTFSCTIIDTDGADKTETFFNVVYEKNTFNLSAIGLFDKWEHPLIDSSNMTMYGKPREHNNTINKYKNNILFYQKSTSYSIPQQEIVIREAKYNVNTGRIIYCSVENKKYVSIDRDYLSKVTFSSKEWTNPKDRKDLTTIDRTDTYRQGKMLTSIEDKNVFSSNYTSKVKKIKEYDIRLPAVNSIIKDVIQGKEHYSDIQDKSREKNVDYTTIQLLNRNLSFSNIFKPSGPNVPQIRNVLKKTATPAMPQGNIKALILKWEKTVYVNINQFVETKTYDMTLNNSTYGDYTLNFYEAKDNVGMAEQRYTYTTLGGNDGKTPYVTGYEITYGRGLKSPDRSFLNGTIWDRNKKFYVYGDATGIKITDPDTGMVYTLQSNTDFMALLGLLPINDTEVAAAAGVQQRGEIVQSEDVKELLSRKSVEETVLAQKQDKLFTGTLAGPAARDPKEDF